MADPPLRHRHLAAPSALLCRYRAAHVVPVYAGVRRRLADGLRHALSASVCGGGIVCAGCDVSPHALAGPAPSTGGEPPYTPSGLRRPAGELRRARVHRVFPSPGRPAGARSGHPFQAPRREPPSAGSLPAPRVVTAAPECVRPAAVRHVPRAAAAVLPAATVDAPSHPTMRRMTRSDLVRPLRTPHSRRVRTPRLLLPPPSPTHPPFPDPRRHGYSRASSPFRSPCRRPGGWCRRRQR